MRLPSGIIYYILCVPKWVLHFPGGTPTSTLGSAKYKLHSSLLPWYKTLNIKFIPEVPFFIYTYPMIDSAQSVTFNVTWYDLQMYIQLRHFIFWDSNSYIKLPYSIFPWSLNGTFLYKQNYFLLPNPHSQNLPPFIQYFIPLIQLIL